MANTQSNPKKTIIAYSPQDECGWQVHTDADLDKIHKMVKHPEYFVELPVDKNGKHYTCYDWVKTPKGDIINSHGMRYVSEQHNGWALHGWMPESCEIQKK